MQKAKRKPRTGTVGASVTAFHAATEEIAPPPEVRLGPTALAQWPGIMRSRARDEWSETDLRHAANLARAFADIERIANEIELEGDVVDNSRGTPIPNPKHSILETLSRRALALTRILHLDAASNGRKENVVAMRAAEKAARQAIKEAAEDTLLA
jgi:hypothetical protein